MKKLIKIAVNDFRLVFRDNSLKIFILLPLLNLPAIRYAMPYIAELYPVTKDYLNIILMLATMQGSIAFGFIYSMVLVDEKDTQVAKVYGILPVSQFWFVVFRLIPPFILSLISTFLLLSVEPFYGLPVVSNFIYSALAALTAPLMILFIAVAAANKIEAMTWQKLFNMPLFLPVLSFFAPGVFSFLFAIFPAFWAYQALNLLIEQKGRFWIYLSIGFIYNSFLIVLMIKKFTRSHFK